MIRHLAIAALVLACCAVPGAAQSPSSSVKPPEPTSAKPAVKKPTSKAKSDPNRQIVAESGPCRLGVISVIGERFSVAKFGVTIFETEFAEIPIDWGLDDLAFARVRALTSTDPTVQRIAYPKGAFDPFYLPKSRLLPDPNEGVPAIVRKITPHTHCERYLVITTFEGKLPNTNLNLIGIGTYNQGLGSLIRHSHLFANIALTLIDGKTYERNNRTLANVRANLSAGLRLTEDPLAKLDNSQFPDPPATASSSTVLREKVRALVAAQLDRLLPDYLTGE